MPALHQGALYCEPAAQAATTSSATAAHATAPNEGPFAAVAAVRTRSFDACHAEPLYMIIHDRAPTESALMPLASKDRADCPDLPLGRAGATGSELTRLVISYEPAKLCQLFKVGDGDECCEI